MGAVYQITEQDVDAFTYGDCWALAKTISQKTGWLAYAVGVYPPHVENSMSKRLDRFDWVHVVVQTPTGIYLDVTGTITAERLVDDYAIHLDDDYPELDGLDFEPVDTEEKWRNLVLDQGRRYPEADANKVADTLILNYYMSPASNTYTCGEQFNISLRDMVTDALISA